MKTIDIAWGGRGKKMPKMCSRLKWMALCGRKEALKKDLKRYVMAIQTFFLILFVLVHFFIVLKPISLIQLHESGFLT